MNKQVRIILFSTFYLLMGCFTLIIAQSTKPNIVIFLADDQGWGDISLNGNSNLETPNIDKIGTEGVRFKNFYVQPVCSPTRAEFLTGRYAFRTGVYSTSAGGERIDLDEITIANVFKNAGYVTGAFGKWHSGMQYPYHPNARGFDEFYGFCSGHWGNYFNPMLEHNGEIVRGEGFLADDITSKAMDFITANKENPFLVYVPFNTPHSPMQVPDLFWDKFKNKNLQLKSKKGDSEDEIFTKAALAMTENLDWNVGRVIKKLEELNLADNTIVIYFTDNGPNGWRWNGGMKGQKGSVDEGGVRSPLLIKWPSQIEKGVEISRISGSIDLLPTLVDLASIEYKFEKRLDGLSLKKSIMNLEEDFEDRILYNFWKGKLSARNQRYRLDQDNKLFDMTIDIGQINDLSEIFPETKSELVLAKKEYLNSVVAELPKQDRRTFPIGHRQELTTQIPARDGMGNGNIVKSNKYPNCSFFTNWIDLNDGITWNLEVLDKGDFEVELYYTCKPGDEGAELELTMQGESINFIITESFDTPLMGMEHDRVQRIESYVKEFKPVTIGRIHLEKGKSNLKLKALTKPGSAVIDLRLLLFKRI
jgi:arylsulfatase A-like enzyme